jgi:hypothetical protein
MATETPVRIDEKLLHATVKLNTALFGGICGAMAGGTLLIATYASLLRGPPGPGPDLSLLGVFLPGYSVTPQGAWFGFLWGFVLGALLGAITYRVYARGIRGRVTEYLAGHGTHGEIQHVVLRLDGPSLGLALGTVAALGLIATTNWLVIRGTASESAHAALLAQYLPGYSVSMAGSFVGAIQIFVVAYAACALLAAIYNRIVDRRQRSRATA